MLRPLPANSDVWGPAHIPGSLGAARTGQDAGDVPAARAGGGWAGGDGGRCFRGGLEGAAGLPLAGGLLCRASLKGVQPASGCFPAPHPPPPPHRRVLIYYDCCLFSSCPKSVWLSELQKCTKMEKMGREKADQLIFVKPGSTPTWQSSSQGPPFGEGGFASNLLPARQPKFPAYELAAPSPGPQTTPCCCERVPGVLWLMELGYSWWAPLPGWAQRRPDDLSHNFFPTPIQHSILNQFIHSQSIHFFANI